MGELDERARRPHFTKITVKGSTYSPCRSSARSVSACIKTLSGHGRGGGCHQQGDGGGGGGEWAALEEGGAHPPPPPPSPVTASKGPRCNSNISAIRFEGLNCQGRMMAATGRQAVKGERFPQIALGGVLRRLPACLPLPPPPSLPNAAVEAVCRIREKLNANGDGTRIRRRGASFRRRGPGGADSHRRCLAAPPTPSSPLLLLSQTTPTQPSTQGKKKIRFIKL